MSLNRRVWLVSLSLVLFAASFVAISDRLVVRGSQGRIYSDPASIPHRSVGILLGCAKHVPGGGESPFFTYRVDAAAQLFNAGKIDYVVVSGDNHVVGYNEPYDMRAALIEAKVPADRIYLDYAGFRTLDSIVRAKEIFGQQQIVVISQPFHNQRAVYIAQHRGIDAIAFNAKDVALQFSFPVLVREKFARAKTVLDLVFGKSPRYLGSSVRIGIDPPNLAEADTRR